MDAIRQIRATRGMSAKITREIGLSRGTVSQWRRIPAERVLDVERITGISRRELRPDLYPLEVSEPSGDSE
ncbi:YdaS family helix-turn-helix protein [Acidisoma sp. 7E03]